MLKNNREFNKLPVWQQTIVALIVLLFIPFMLAASLILTIVNIIGALIGGILVALAIAWFMLVAPAWQIAKNALKKPKE